MSIINILKRRISSLEAENEELRQRIQSTESDMRIVYATAFDFWNQLSIAKMTEGMEGAKPNVATISKIALNIGKKFMTKQISIEELSTKWKEIEPIFKKYEHVIKEEQHGNGND